VTNADDEMSPSDRILMNALAEAIGDTQPQRDLVARCEGLLAWMDVDSELAALLDQPVAEAVGTRGTAPPDAALVFVVGDGTCVIELTSSGSSLRGQLLGGRADEIVARTVADAVHRAPIDETGIFSIENPPTGTIRLELELFSDGRRIHTDWFVV
jgi:hypothetical protein